MDNYYATKDKLPLKGVWTGPCNQFLNGTPPVYVTDEDRQVKFGVFLHCESKNWTLFHLSITLANAVRF